MKKFRKKAVLAKIEATYGVEAAPAAANAILMTDVTFAPMEGQTVKRGVVQPYLGAEEEIPVGIHSILEGKVEMAGAGAAGTVPGWGLLHRICGFSEVVTAATDVVYQPVSEAFESATVHFHMDGTLHKMLGVRGTVSLEFEVPNIARWKYRLVGLHVDPADVALPAVDFSAFQTPLPTGNVNTPTFTLNGVSLVMAKLSLEMGAAAEHDEMVNLEEVDIGDRQAKGSLMIEAPPLATLNVWALAKPPITKVPMVLEHGVGAGKIVRLEFPSIQILPPKSYVERKSKAMLEPSFLALPTDAGNDEVAIIVK